MNPVTQDQGARLMLELQNYDIDPIRYTELVRQAKQAVQQTLADV